MDDAGTGDHLDPNPTTRRQLIRGRIEPAETAPHAGETFVDLAYMGGVRVEAIYSSDSPDPTPYVQDHDEWVIVIDGGARLDVDGEQVEMTAGDWILIRAGVEHRVLHTRAGTRWIAVHVQPR